MSALAQWYKRDGWQVTGSDGDQSIITDSLKKSGIKVSIATENSKMIDAKTDLIVYSNAVPADHPERVKASAFGVTELSYPQALGQLTKSKKTIAVSGTHGKSTTTAMAALILIEAGFDPTVIIGTRIPQLRNNNFRFGKSEWLVIEADEYKEAFLNYSPYLAVATNVEADHLDYYKGYTHVKNSFKKFFGKIKKGGYFVANAKDVFLKEVLPKSGVKKVLFSINSKRAERLAGIIRVPGRHNLANALAADAVAECLKIKVQIRNRALKNFKGTWRRFEYKGTFQSAKVYDDYAHHPTEIKAVLQAARELYPTETIWCVHQPHHTSRLQNLFSDFVGSFDEADKVIILETYKVKGRENEEANPKRSAQALAKMISKEKAALYAATQDDVINILRGGVQKNDIVLITGAGDITDVAHKLTKR